jgi:DNA-binding transcriptional LysR family regulator
MEQNLQYLEANKFLIRYHYIYKYKSYKKAAENYYVSSTDRNMSYAVDQLEAFYGVQLIRVHGNRLEFTEFGHIIGGVAQQVFQMNKDAKSKLDKVNLREINFATTADSYKYYVSQILLKFQEENPDVKVFALKTYYDDAARKLQQNEIDFYVGPVALERNSDFEYKSIGVTRTVLAVKNERKDEFNFNGCLSDFLPFKGAMKDKTSTFHTFFEKEAEKLGLKLDIALETSDVETLVDAVKNDVVDYAIIGNYYKDPDLHFIDITKCFEPLEICFVSRKGEVPTLALEKLIEVSQLLRVKPMDV